MAEFAKVLVHTPDNRWVELKDDDLEKVSVLAREHKNLAVLHNASKTVLGENLSPGSKICFDFTNGIALHCDSATPMTLKWISKGDDVSEKTGPVKDENFRISTWNVLKVVGDRFRGMMADFGTTSSPLKAASDLPAYYTGGKDSCFRCGAVFNVFRWRNACRLCKINYCADCMAQSKPCCNADEGACVFCKLTNHRDHSDRLAGKMQSNEYFDDCDVDAHHVELVYALPYLVAAAQYEAKSCGPATSRLLATLNPIWKMDADQCSLQYQNATPEQRSLAFARLLVACTQEGSALVNGSKSTITRDSNPFACATWLCTNAASLGNASTLESTLRARMASALRKGALAARAFNPQSPASASTPYPLLNMVGRIVADPLVSSDAATAAKAVEKLSFKLDEMATTLEQANFVRSYLSTECWQREIIRAFPDVDVAVNCLSAVFLYTLESLQLYRVLNTALREADAPVKALVEPLRQYLAIFLTAMPAKANVVYRGQSYRVVEQLDENEPPAPLPNFTSTTVSFSVAYNAFLQGNRAGSFLIYIAYESVPISCFSSFEGEGEVLLPHGANFETVHRVPLSHLAIMNQRFDVACSQQIPNVKVRPSERVRLCMEALRAVSNAYREIQNYFIAPHLSHGASENAPSSKLLDSVTHVLGMPSDGLQPTWMTISAIAGMGKSTVSIFVNSFINETKLLGYHSLLISLPAVGKTLFERDALELHMKKRLRFGDAEMALLRQEKFVVILDSLDEVPIKVWPTTSEIGGSLDRRYWPNLRVIITCRGEHLEQHHLNYNTISGGRGVEYGIVPFQQEEVMRLVSIWIPGDGESEIKARAAALKDYHEQPGSFHTPFMLYLLANSHRTSSVELSALPPKPSFNAAPSSPGMKNNNNNNNNNSTTELGREGDKMQNELSKIRDAHPTTEIMSRWAHENQHVDMLGPSSSSSANHAGRNVRDIGDADSELRPVSSMIQDDFGNPVGSPLSPEVRETPSSPGCVAVDFQLANETGICAVYEKGIKALIAQNILHMGKVTSEELSRLVEDVFEWSQLVSIIMLADDRWKATLGSLPELFESKLRSYFSLDPTLMVLLAPLRISGYTSSAPFEFRHKSVHEFLAAFCAANCASTRRLEFTRHINFAQHPNAMHFLSQLEKRNPIESVADITCCVKYGDIRNVVLSSRYAKRLTINNVLRTQVPPPIMGQPLQLLSHLELHCPAEIVNRILPMCPRLECLILSHPSVTDATVAGFIQSAATLRSINLSGTSITEATLRVISQFVNGIRGLDLSHCPCIQNNSALLSMSPDRLKQLSYLNLSGHVDKINEVLVHFAQSARDSLQSVDISNTIVTDQTIAHLVSAARMIKTIDISGTHLTDRALRSILTKLGFLSQLSCQECRHLTDKPFFDNKEAIKTRNLLNIDFDNSPSLCTDDALFAIAHKSSNLWGISLEISPELKNKIPANGLADRGLSALAEKCPLLVHVNVRGLQTVSAQGFSRLIARIGAHVQYVDISFCNPERMKITALRDTVRYCENLRTLRCDNTFTEVDDPAFDQIEYLGVEMRDLSFSVGTTPGRSSKVAGGCSKLRRLHLHSDSGNNKVSLDSSEMLNIVKACPNLQEIGVHRMKGVGNMSTFPSGAPNLRSLEFTHIDGTFDDSTLISIFAQCKLMRSVRIDDCGRAFTDDSIKSIADNCPNLRIFSANATRRQISDAGAVNIARGCPQLVECNIVGAYGQVADATLIALGQGCPELRTVSMGSNSGKITNAGIIGLANGCHHLEYIDVADARGDIGGAAVIALATQCPNLRVMNVFNTGANIGIDALKVVGERGTQLQVLQLGVTASGVKQEHLDELLRKLPLIDEIHFSLKA